MRDLNKKLLPVWNDMRIMWEALATAFYFNSRVTFMNASVPLQHKTSPLFLFFILIEKHSLWLLRVIPAAF